MTLLVLFFLGLLVIAAPLQASESHEPDLGWVERMESRQKRVSEWVLTTVDNFDRRLELMLAADEHTPSATFSEFFGDRRIDEEAPGSCIVIFPGVRIDRNKIDPRLRFSTKLNMPRLERYAALVVQNIGNEETVFADSLDLNPPENSNEDQSSAAVRLYLIKETRFSTDVDVGLRLNPAPVPTSRVRGKVRIRMDEWTLRLAESLFWRSDDGFGEKTTAEFGRWVGKQSRFETSSSALYSESSEGWELGQLFTFYHSYRDRHEIGCVTGLETVSEPAMVVSRYLLRFPYRYRTSRDWMYFLMEPGVDFLEEDGYEILPLVILSMEFRFGDTSVIRKTRD